MASTTAISFTLPPTPLPRLSLFSNPPPEAFSLFPQKLRRSRVFVKRGKDNDEFPSELRQRKRRGSVHDKNGGERFVSYNMMPRILKPLASIMLFGSAGDQSKGVEERRRELILQYMSYDEFAIVLKKEYYCQLARILKEWYTDVQEQEEERSMEIDFRRLIRIFDFFRGCNWTWKMPWFEIILLLCVTGVVLSVLGILFLPSFLIWKFLFRRPDPPPSPPPFNPKVVKKLLPFINPDRVNNWLPFDPNTVVKDLLPFVNFDIVKKCLEMDPSVVKDLLPVISSVKLSMLATQLRVLIPMMFMVAAVK